VFLTSFINFVYECNVGLIWKDQGEFLISRGKYVIYAVDGIVDYLDIFHGYSVCASAISVGV
jgi:hypothetical protein